MASSYRPSLRVLLFGLVLLPGCISGPTLAGLTWPGPTADDGPDYDVVQGYGGGYGNDHGWPPSYADPWHRPRSFDDDRYDPRWDRYGRHDNGWDGNRSGGRSPYANNGRCDDPRYETSNGGRAAPGTDEADCRRNGNGLKGRYRR